MSTVSKLLNRLNITYQKPRPFHANKDVENADFWSNEMFPCYIDLAKKLFPTKEIEIWYEDETRFGAKTRLSGMWALKNNRPQIPNGLGYRNAYLIGSINPETGERIAHLHETCNSDIMNIHLAELSAYLGYDTHVLLVMDGASWHRSKKLKVPENISIITLPAYSPELNPIERLWGWLKSNYLSNKVLNSTEEILNLGSNAWNALTDQLVKSICATDHGLCA